jgi:hypothetical protein
MFAEKKFRKKLSLIVCACHRSNSRKLKIGGSQSWPTWAKSETLFLVLLWFLLLIFSMLLFFA